jgi:hypothetical protein
MSPMPALLPCGRRAAHVGAIDCVGGFSISAIRV